LWITSCVYTIGPMEHRVPNYTAYTSYKPKLLYRFQPNFVQIYDLCDDNKDDKQGDLQHRG